MGRVRQVGDTLKFKLKLEYLDEFFEWFEICPQVLGCVPVDLGFKQVTVGFDGFNKWPTL